VGKNQRRGRDEKPAERDGGGAKIRYTVEFLGVDTESKTGLSVGSLCCAAIRSQIVLTAAASVPRAALWQPELWEPV